MTDFKDIVKSYIKDKNIDQRALAKILNYSEDYISRILSGRVRMNGKFKMKVIDTFSDLQVNFVGQGRKYEPFSEYPDVYEADDGKIIPFYNTEVFATISPAMADVVALKPDTFISIPMFAQGDFALQVTGNSMKGMINNGDWIVVKRITNKNAIIYGEMYLIVTKSDNLKTVKFVKQHEDESLLWLIPYNIEQFEQQTIEKEEILEMYSIAGLFRSV